MPEAALRQMAMHDPGSPSPGEIGGIFAGIVALLATIGAGFRFLFNWTERRASSRAAKLEAWHNELKEREAKLDNEQTAFQARLEESVAQLGRENRALRLAFQLVSAPLRTLDPSNPALIRAEQLLQAAFPLDADISADLERLIAAIPDAD